MPKPVKKKPTKTKTVTKTEKPAKISPIKATKKTAVRARTSRIPELPPLVEHPHHPYQPSFWAIFFKATALAFVFAFIMLLLTAIGVAVFAFSKLQVFTSAAQISLPQLKQIAETGWRTTPVMQDGRKNILLLGIDSLATRGDEPPLTDTMMFISVDMATGQVYTVPLPRDIWSSEYQTKINSLYQFGMKKYPDHPEQFSAEALSTLTQVPIHHTIVVSLEQVSQLIDLVGGVDLDVPTAFTDPLFPRPDVDVTKVHDPKLLYQTVTFETGKQHMNGERVLQYVRSRHSSGITGTDNDRGARQQLVMQALIGKLLNQNTIKDLQLDGKLFHFYMTNFDKYFPMTQVIATAKALLPVRKNIALHSSVVSVYPTDPKGVLVNPPQTKYKQWVYEIKNLTQFQTEVRTHLQIPATMTVPIPTPTATPTQQRVRK